jgi:hypothetical protein
MEQKSRSDLRYKTKKEEEEENEDPQSHRGKGREYQNGFTKESIEIEIQRS